MRERWYKDIIRAWVPPVLMKLRPGSIDKNAKRAQDFSGEYASWEAAQAACSGYDDSTILEQCKNALLKVKHGEFAYERDGVLFENIQYNWPLLTGLQKTALEHGGDLSVLDFGGSLGSSYFQNRAFLAGLKSLSWSIVEQKHFVNCGKENFEHEHLAFYYSIADCLARKKPNVVLLSGVLQYLEKPYQWLAQLNSMSLPYIILDRTSFVHHSNEILTKQQVPGSMYEASYPAWFLMEKKVTEALTDYDVLMEFPSYCDPAGYLLNGKYNTSWEGRIYTLKTNAIQHLNKKVGEPA